MRYGLIQLSLILLVACSAKPQNSVSEMRGTMRISLEEAELLFQGKTYYLNDPRGILLPLIKEARQKTGAFEVVREVCVKGHKITRENNSGNSFGASGRYEQAIIVESLC
ncbi:hypothetical protein ACTHTU_10405 [Neisseria sp. P0020.S005]|uniref:hypothetical protein n=1 Tax=Neisseria sp. P0020.S005 TaxID=3436810 RepID=UPI003F7FE442